MIVQRILDFFATIVSGWLNLIPDLPPLVSDLLAEIQAGAAYVGQLVTNFGIVMPWDSFAVVVGWWIAGLAFWFVVSVVRVVLWAVGR